MLACAAGLAACSPSTPTGKGAEEPSRKVNVYSGRHYDSDKAVYAAFTEKTGIDVRTVEAEGNQLLERLKAEGEYANADVVITVDAGNLYRLAEADLLAPVTDEALDAATPARLRDPEGRWRAFSKRARVIAYAKDSVDPATIASMDDLADPEFRGQVCARSSTALYNLSMMAGRIERLGRDAALNWARGVVANFARPPRGSDVDQLRAIAAGECKLAIVNHYYLARMARSTAPEDQIVLQKVGMLAPDQSSSQEGAGAHVNVSGAGMAKHARNKAEALELLRFLSSAEAQSIIAKLNDEIPVAANVEVPPEVAPFVGIKEEEVSLAALGRRQADAQAVFDEAGWR